MKDYLYKKIATTINQQIDREILQPGDRLPSIRRLSQELKVSIGTVQAAYATLEDQGLVIPKPRSGYYVKMHQALSIAPPEAAPSFSSPKGVSVLETAISVMQSATLPNLIQMGSAIPNVQGSAIKHLHKELKRHVHKVPNYEEHPQGFQPLRRQIARRSISAGGSIHPDEIVVTAGCQEALTIALRCIARPGDVIAVESPCYYGALLALEVLDLKVVEVPVSPADGLHIADLKSALKKWPIKGILLNPAFSNPSGYLCSDFQKRELIRLITRYDIGLIEDDVFAELSFLSNRPRSIQSYDRDGRVIYCSSISKTVSSDLRIGWMAPGRYLDQAKAIKYISTLSTQCHTQFALSDFLATSRIDRHIRSLSWEYAKKQRLLVREIGRLFPGNTNVTQPKGGFLCWVKLPEEIDGLALYYAALKEGITVAPGEIFSSTDRFTNYIRLNYAVASDEQIRFSVKTIARLIAEQAKMG